MRPPMCSVLPLLGEAWFRKLILEIFTSHCSPVKWHQKIPLHRLDSNIYKVLVHFFKNTIGGINLACLLILILGPWRTNLYELPHLSALPLGCLPAHHTHSPLWIKREK